MVTRAQSNIYKPKKPFSLHTTTSSSLSQLEPIPFTQATKQSHWRDTMRGEFLALHRNHTWSLAPLSPTQNIVGCKWVYRIKRNPDGSIARYKARLVAKGFHQRPAPRAWYTELRSFLLGYGFINSKSDTSLFIYTSGTCIMYLLIYVDDILLISNHTSMLRTFTTRLSNRFSLKDLGELNYFLGVETIRTSTGLFLSQQRYILDLLQRTNMHEAKEVSTPLSSSETLKLDDGSLRHDPTEYR
ncbi:Retrovirus-related Pol polyprotein from transposon TNT 1-94 [Melia azedarach]|uniref:Retrovirus-related Pol polyprotein from transposon TNT 1-94 n=1 Tax=Melia azedarach TaxID=155640 RepID=A0ACC1YC69_MELAZ|nr:Retrovirus-related Pol polyprotein from transposon TNT 1-94 [Melia azedarach]